MHRLKLPLPVFFFFLPLSNGRSRVRKKKASTSYYLYAYMYIIEQPHSLLNTTHPDALYLKRFRLGLNQKEETVVYKCRPI